MAVTITKSRRGPGYWALTWSSDLGGTPTFYVYVDGLLAFTTIETSHTFQVAANEHIQIEILDDASAPQPAFPANLYMQWLPVSGAAKYRIDQWNGSAWVALRTVQEIGRASMEHRTPFLDDQTTYTFRIVPIGDAEIDGAARQFVVAMVRTPSIPVVTAATYASGTGKVTLNVA